MLLKKQISMIIYFFINKTKKKLSKGLKSKGGRNFLGRVCVRGQGGGHKKLYRFIDFFRRLNLKGKVINILYDPNRSAQIALILYLNSLCSYIIIQKEIFLNDIIYSGTKLCEDIINIGYSMPLQYIPLFSNVSNIELRPFKGSSLCRAAGTSCLLVGKIKNKCILKLKSGWEMHLSINNIASLGIISDKIYNNWYINKAGKNRNLGWKPKVRGVAKNPCDHPHGGGNGKKHKPMIPTNAWHTVFKWYPTKNRKIDYLKRRKFKNINEN